MKKIIIGTRGSRLALRQAAIVAGALRRHHKGPIETRVIKTSGDIKPRRSGKGDFVKEIDAALLEGSIDIAVHSVKDMPAGIARGLVLASVPKRESPYDALVSRGRHSLKSLPFNSSVGTGSLRRKYQLLDVRDDVRVEKMRGNVDTRLKKTKKMDAIILAEAGLRRLEFSEYKRIPAEQMVPCAGQGALGVVCREHDWVVDVLKRMEDQRSRREVEEELACIKALGADCRTPVGALARVHGNRIKMYGALWRRGKLVRKFMEDGKGIWKRMAGALK